MDVRTMTVGELAQTATHGLSSRVAEHDALAELARRAALWERLQELLRPPLAQSWELYSMDGRTFSASWIAGEFKADTLVAAVEAALGETAQDPRP